MFLEGKGHLELVGKKVVLNTSVTMRPVVEMRIIIVMCITYFILFYFLNVGLLHGNRQSFMPPNAVFRANFFFF